MANIIFPEEKDRVNFKKALEKENIPYRVNTKWGKEYVKWDGKHKEAIERINAEMRGLFASVSFGNKEKQEQMKVALQKENIPFHVKVEDGRELIKWNFTYQKQVKELQIRLFGKPPPPGSSIHISGEFQQKFKEALDKENIPYSLSIEDDKEFIHWNDKYKESVFRIEDKLFQRKPPPADRSIELKWEMRDRFTKWLDANKITYITTIYHGTFYVLWEEQETEKVSQWEEFSKYFDQKSQLATKDKI